MSLKEEFKKPYNIIASIVLVALILIWAPWSDNSEGSERETAEGLLFFFSQLPRDESEKVCAGLVQLEEKIGGKYPELDAMKEKVSQKHGCDG